MKIGIIDLCKQIEDPSMNRKKVHKMETSIYIFIAAVICEVQSWNEIEEFGNSKMTAWSSSPVMILLTDSSV
ncbi:transposase family protein [Phocaeicola vulgatus]|uniref:transposase family protein n=1 Tax=Phocaeicola vulgatus TaxID=821 RepID=UPI002FD8AF4E